MSDAQAGNFAAHPCPSSPRPPTRTLSRRERAVVLARINALMEFWHITSDELAHAPPAPPPVFKPRPVKYRHPISGLTWDGEGPHPQWLRDALLKEGYRVDELRPEQHTTPTHWS